MWNSNVYARRFIRTAPVETLDAELRALQKDFKPAHTYIQDTWEVLDRTHKSWFLGALEDSKVSNGHTPPYYLYISDKEDIENVKRQLAKARAKVVERIRRHEADPDNEKSVVKIAPVTKTVRGEEITTTELIAATEENIPKLEDIEIVRLTRNPETGYLNPPHRDKHGLLYLPHPYIVPGVRFNEMYNWDSAITARGLMCDGEFERAKHLVDNMLYEIEHYGTVLNGNRTYYLDSQKPRSQPPLLTGILEPLYKNYEHLKKRARHGKDKVTWLADTLHSAEQNYNFWMTEPHMVTPKAGSTLTPLSMYNSMRTDPSDEVEYCESEHYKNARNELIKMYSKITDKLGKKIVDAILAAETLSAEQADTVRQLPYQERKDLYYIEQYLAVDGSGERTRLSDAFYRGDWAMRESGFDPSRRFGFFNVDIINHIPVCLNSLRYKSETEMATLYEQLAKDDLGNRSQWLREKSKWDKRSEATKAAMQQLWDPGDGKGRLPAFRDLNIQNVLVAKYDLPKFRDYDYATALFPMWAGLATDEQAKAIVEYIYPRLMSKRGLDTSRRAGTGCQWDYPMMWAPLQIAAMEGLERHGYYNEAWEIGSRYARTQIDEFKRTGRFWEKTNSTWGTAKTEPYIKNGYSTNDYGFAWTNGTVVEIMQALPRLLEKIKRKKQETPAGADINGSTIVPNGEHGRPNFTQRAERGVPAR